MDNRAEGFDAGCLNYLGVINRILLEVTEQKTFDLHLRMSKQSITMIVVAEFIKNDLSHAPFFS